MNKYTIIRNMVFASALGLAVAGCTSKPLEEKCGPPEPSLNFFRGPVYNWSAWGGCPEKPGKEESTEAFSPSEEGTPGKTFSPTFYFR
jgi:hypothetical protein